MVAFYDRRRVSTPHKHVVLLIEPMDSSFKPTNYRERPRLFRIIATMVYKNLGEADCKRFMFNRVAMTQGSHQNRWTLKGGVQ